jgi:hypothetical protein
MKCVLCDCETNKMVHDVNICEKVPLCDDCKKMFKECKKCNEFFYSTDLTNGVCPNCLEGEDE